MVVHETFCIIDNNDCKDNTKQNITTLAVCDTSYTFSMKPYNIQQNMTTTAGKTTQHKTKQLWRYVLFYTPHNITSMVVNDTSITKPYNRQQYISTMAVNDTSITKT